MAVTLKIKRSSTTATPSSLVQGELAYSELSQNLFFGSTGGVIKIGGLSDVQKLAASTASNTPNAIVQRDGNGSIEVQDITVFGNLNVTGDTTVAGETVYTGDTVFEGDIFVNGGDIKSTATSFNLFPTTVTTLNIAPQATSVAIGGANTTTTFAGNVNIGGSLTVAQTATVAMDFTADTATITGDLMVNGNTYLGNEASDTTTIQGVTTIITPTILANASTTTDAFVIKTQDNNPLFQVKQNGDTVIAGVLTVNGTGTSTFAGNVAIGGSITVAEGATVTADFTANTATITGDLMVDGNTYLGNDAAVDSTTVKGRATIQTARTQAAAQQAFTADGASALVDAFKVVDSAGAPLFQVKDNGDTILAGILTVNGQGTSTFAGDVSIAGSIYVSEDATVTADFTADTATIVGNLNVNGNTYLGNESTDATEITGTLSVSENATFAKNVTIEGDLVVNGATTTVNSTQTTLTDPVLSLAQDTTAADGFDRGVDFKWHNGTDVKQGFFGFDISTQKFAFLPDATVTNGAYAGTPGTLVATRFEGLADRAEKLETARSITLSGDVTGTVLFDGTDNVTIATTIQPNSVVLGSDTTGQYAKTVAVSGLGLTATTPATEDGTDYTVSSNATVDATVSTLVYRGTNAEVKAGYFVAESGTSRFKGGIDGLAEDGTTKSELTNFVIDGGTF